MDSQLVSELLTNQKLIIEQMLAQQDAVIRYTGDVRPTPHFRITLDLTTAVSDQNPEVISFPFNGYVVESATDDSVSLKLALNSYSKENTSQYKILKNNDSADSDTTFRKGFLMWDAQPGKTVTLVFFLGVKFRPGSLRSVLSGGVSVTTGSGMTPESPVAVTSAATLLQAANSNRKMLTVGNPRNSGNDMWVSGTTALTDENGAFPGVLLEPGDYYEFRGQGALYGITTSGTVNATLQTEV